MSRLDDIRVRLDKAIRWTEQDVADMQALLAVADAAVARRDADVALEVVTSRLFGSDRREAAAMAAMLAERTALDALEKGGEQ